MSETLVDIIEVFIYSAEPLIQMLHFKFNSHKKSLTIQIKTSPT